MSEEKWTPESTWSSFGGYKMVNGKKIHVAPVLGTTFDFREKFFASVPEGELIQDPLINDPMNDPYSNGWQPIVYVNHRSES